MIKGVEVIKPALGEDVLLTELLAVILTADSSSCGDEQLYYSVKTIQLAQFINHLRKSHNSLKA